MRIPQSGLLLDDPAFPLLQASISFWGTTSAVGAPTGDTVVCAGLLTESSYDGLQVKLLTGLAAGQVRLVAVHPAPSNTLTTDKPFTDAAGGIVTVAAGTLFVILSNAPGGGGTPPSASAEGLYYSGTVGAVPGANQFTIAALAGLGAGKFIGATNPYSAFVVRDAGGAGGAPQGEIQVITAYATATGNFTAAGFGGGGIAVGDEVLIVNPALANAIILALMLLVPAPDAVANVDAVDVIGNKASTAIYVPTNTADIIRYLKGLLNSRALPTRPLPELFEGWQDEAGIDAALWTVTDPATGAPWTRGAFGSILNATCAPNANETARIRGTQRWLFVPMYSNEQRIIRRSIMEFELRINVGPDFLDPAACFFGLTEGIADTRATPNLMGFGLVMPGIVNLLQTVSDLGGVETVNTGFGEDLTAWNKLRIEAYPDNIAFYVNEVLVATHAANRPSLPFYPNFYLDTAGGATTFRIGIVRIWHEDIPR